MNEPTVSSLSFPSQPPPPRSRDVLTQLLHEKVGQLLVQAVEAEADQWLVEHAAVVDEQGRRQVVRNGHLPRHLRGKATAMLHDVWMAQTRAQAVKTLDLFVTTFKAKYPPAVAQLEWRDVDFKEWSIHIRDESRGGAPTGSESMRTTKSGRSRHIPIHKDLRPVFESISKIRQGQVFHGPRGGDLKPDLVRNVLMRDVLEPLTYVHRFRVKRVCFTRKTPASQRRGGFVLGKNALIHNELPRTAWRRAETTVLQRKVRGNIRR